MRANKLPLSILIIGVGDEPMELNQKIFNTEYLRDSTEGGMIRDFVRFVHLMDYVDINLKFDKESFTKNVLRDVPM